MRWRPAILVLLAAGCESSPIEYDPVRDSSKLSALVSTRKPDSKSNDRVDLILHLNGRGRHPAGWSSSLEVSVKTSGGPDLLGDTPTLTMNPGSPGQRMVEATRQHGPTKRIGDVNDSAIFEVPLNSLVYMLDRGRTIELNGAPWTLDDTEMKVMRDLIAVAQKDTRAGR